MITGASRSGHLEPARRARWPQTAKHLGPTKDKDEVRAVGITVALSRERRERAPDESLCRGHVSADSNTAASSSSSTPGWWCAGRRLQRNVIRLVECGRLTDDNVGRSLPGPNQLRPRTPSGASPQLDAPDDVAGHSAPRLDGDARRAPNQFPSVLTLPPAIASAREEHRRRASATLQISSWRAVGREHETPRTNQKRRRITRRPYNYK
jgi:hypothetical protein